MPAKGLKQVRHNVAKIIGEIGASMPERAVYEALLIIDGNAALLTPVDTSNLINSRFIEVKKAPDGIHGKMGYTAEYAAAVHEMSGKLKGQPREDFGVTRSGQAFGGGTKTGNYWDPNAEPEFLKKGAENARADIDRVVKKRMKL